jgi:hypothetical protein
MFSVFISFPKDLGGHVYSKFFHSQTFPEPDIKSSYVTYLNDVFDDGTTVSSILTQAVISDGFIINKSVDTNTLTNLSSKLKISFVNLNRSEFGNQIINFMRQNVAVLKVSAGYGDNLYTYFEGMINDISITEGLDQTIASVSATDLMTKLFKDENTCIVV